MNLGDLSYAEAFQAVAQIAAAASLVLSLELWWLYRRGEFNQQGLWNWNAIDSSMAPITTPFGFIFSKSQSIPILLTIRTLSALAVLLAGWIPQVLYIGVVLLGIAQLLLNVRLIWGDDGADQMLSVVLLALSLTIVSGASEVAIKLALLFLSAQITLSYVSSGCAKLFGRQWRDGTAFLSVMGHHTYGNMRLHQLLLRWPFLSAAVGYAVISFQIAFPVYFVLPSDFAAVMLGIGIAFHAGIALVNALE